MLVRTRAAASLLAGALLLAACTGGSSGADSDTGADNEAAADPQNDTDTETETAAGPDAGAAEDAGAVEDGGAPVLATTATAPDGSTFTIGDFAGQPVFVETFATWCSTCRRQLGATQQAAVEAGQDAVFLILSVETTIDAASLADYAAEQGFDDLRFGLLDEQGLVTFEEAFGRSVLNPPSTPKFRVSPDGEISQLTTGMESAEEILATLSTS